MDLYTEFFSVVQALANREIPYAVIGGIAMAIHDQPRFTHDIDLLVLPEDMDRIYEAMASIGYSESATPWTFRSTRLTLYRFLKTEGEDHLTIDILSGADEGHRRIVHSAIEEEWSSGFVRVAKKEDIIWLKKQRGSDQDNVDIRSLSDDKD